MQYHGFFNQMLSTTTAVTWKKARKYAFDNKSINFVKFKKNLYFGFNKYELDYGTIKIADSEKAILDLLYLRNDDYTVNLIWEVLLKNKNEFDHKKLSHYALKFSTSIIRKIGLIFDELELPTEELHKAVSGKKSYGKLTKGSREFNSKWRIYIDRSIIGQT